MTLLLIVERIRGKTCKSFSEANAWLLTADTQLIKYAHSRNVGRQSCLPLAIHARDWLAFLRPWLPRTKDYDRAAVALISSDRFRTFGGINPFIIDEITRILASYNDMTPELAAEMLADHGFTRQIMSIERKIEQEISGMSQDETAGDSQSYLESVVHRVGTTELSKAVESAAIRIADAKEKERAQAIHDLTDVKKDIGQLAARVDSLTHQQSIMEEDLTSKEHVIETLTQESVEAQGKVQSLTAEVSIIQSEAKNLRRKLTLAKWLWATLVVVIGGIVLFVIPSVFPSKWLNDHPNRLGLYGCIVCIVLAVAWAIVDSKRRKFAVGTVLVGAIFVLLQIIGR